MATAFGPTFFSELQAAGLAGLPFSWRADGIIDGRQNLTSDENATLDRVVAAHNPNAVVVPQSVNQLQARRALRAAGLIDAVNAAVAAADADTKDAWQYAPEIHRDNPIISQMASGLGLTDVQIDQLFIAAAAL